MDSNKELVVPLGVTQPDYPPIEEIAPEVPNPPVELQQPGGNITVFPTARVTEVVEETSVPLMVIEEVASNMSVAVENNTPVVEGNNTPAPTPVVAFAGKDANGFAVPTDACPPGTENKIIMGKPSRYGRCIKCGRSLNSDGTHRRPRSDVGQIHGKRQADAPIQAVLPLTEQPVIETA